MPKPGHTKALSLVAAVLLAVSAGCVKGVQGDTSADGGKKEQQEFEAGKYFGHLFYLDRAADGEPMCRDGIVCRGTSPGRNPSA